jgi:Heavy-metal resistance protein CzcE
MRQTLIASLLVAGVAAASPSFALTQADMLGEPGNPAFADRTLEVSPSTRYLNVVQGETVTLDVNGQPVTWDFDGLAMQLSLQDIVPGAPNIQIYVREPSDN